MASIIEMPKLSDTMTVGTVANWIKNEGDKIETGDIIAEIETDKATMELESFEDGTLLKQIAKAGEQVAVGGPIAAIGEEGDSVDIPDTPAAPVASEPETSEDAPAQAPEASSAAPAIIEAAKPSGAPVKASPLAKKLAAEHGLELSAIKGSGPNGRIVKKDVLAAAEGKPATTGSKAAISSSSGSVAFNAPIASEEDIPVSQLRSVIATRLVESKTTAPHFYLETEVNVGDLLALRVALNAELSELAPEQGGVKFTVNDFILKASAEALRRVPAMNRAWQGQTIRQHGAVHLAFGVAIDDGLVTPVVRNAESKGLKQIAVEAKELIGKARAKKLKPDEMSGSTFTVTNLGMFGVSSFYGIINTPNAGILSVGATIKRPIVNEAGEIVPGQIMKIGLSGDHRTIDGAVGAQFLQALKKILETPALILV